MKLRMGTTLFSCRRITTFVTLLLILSILLPNAPVSSAASYSNIQPYLLQLADEEPTLSVSAIVQGNVEDARFTQWVESLGGKVTRNLSMIHAFAIQMPVGNIKALAQHPAISWIAMDAPVQKSSDGDAVVLRNDFGRNGVTNSSGWLRNTSGSEQVWSESGESDGPNFGEIAVVQFLGGAYDGVRFQGSNKGLSTQVNLVGAVDASLNWGYRRKNFDNETDCIVVTVSTDAGSTDTGWNELHRVCGPVTDAELQMESINLSAYVGSKIVLRFQTTETFTDNERFYINYANFLFTPRSEAQQETVAYRTFLPVITNSDNSTIAATPAGESDTTPVAPEIAAANIESLFYVLDEFNSFTWGNNNGHEHWSSSWLEVDPETMSGGPGLGAVRITGGALRFDDYPDTGGEPSAAREVDLRQGVASASLTFNFWTSSKVEPVDAAVVEISTDNGSTYTVLETFTGISGATWQLRNYDLSSYLPAKILVRFRIANDYGKTGKFFYVDDVRVDYDRVSNGTGWVVLVPDASEWRFQNKDANIDAGWKNISFDDSAWSLGQSEFGYGDSDEATVITGNGAPSTLKVAYFRRRFSVSDARAFSKLTLSFIKDDGAVVYLNGSELYRSNMPSTTITADTPALIAIDGTEESRWNSVEVPSNLLTTGENVIAVELHQATSDTTDMSFDMEVGGNTSCIDCMNSAALQNNAVKSIKADQLWNSTKRLQGQSITVAVVDSGISRNYDNHGSLGTSRVIKHVNFVSGMQSVDDSYGHGSHVAGTIGGNGAGSAGAYAGVAPKVSLVDVRVTNDAGIGSTSDVVAGLQWIYENRLKYNIRVVNLSLNSSIAESYHTSPLNAALEVLWFNKVVVVVSSGNNGTTVSGVLYPPANDPFVITVGATDDKGTASISDDDIPNFSAFGTTSEGFAKPEIVAPGRNIISTYASDDCNICINHPNNIVYSTNGNRYLRISGTSMASAVAAGAVALLLQSEPTLTPDQVKYRLMATANKNWSAYSSLSAGAGYLDSNAATSTITLQSANTGVAASQLLWTGPSPTVWSSVNWNSVNWNSVNWNSINWNSINWNSLNWSSVTWE